MKILYVGHLEPVGYTSTTKMRMLELKRLGHAVFPLDEYQILRWGDRISRGIVLRLGFGPPLWSLARKIERMAGECRPEIVWIDKGVWVFPKTLRRLRAGNRPFLVHYTPDPAIVFHKSRRFLRSIPIYDLLVTTKSYEVDLYRQYGARNLLLQYPSFDYDVHRPEVPTPEEEPLYKSDIAFIGSYGPGREKYLLPLSRLGIDLAIWGGGWAERCKYRELRVHVRGPSLAGRDYALAISCAKIGLGLLSPLVPDSSTTRSLEIPACGTFLLAERTKEHQVLFEEGKEAEFFAFEDELIEKTHYYLNHAEERERIALAGRERCLNDGYSSHHRVREVMERVDALLQTGQLEGL